MPLPFDQRATEAVGRAAAEAAALGHAYVGSQHLLLALFGEPTGAVAAVLRPHLTSMDEVRRQVRLVYDVPPVFAGLTPLQSPAVRRLLVEAQDEARRLGRSEVAPEHLLLCLLRTGRGYASAVLAALGGDPAGVFHALATLLEGAVGAGPVSDDDGGREAAPVWAPIARPPERGSPAARFSRRRRLLAMIELASGTFAAFSPDAQVVMAAAFDAAEASGDYLVTTGHLLLAMHAVDGTGAATTLARAGLDCDRIRSALAKDPSDIGRRLHEVAGALFTIRANQLAAATAGVFHEAGLLRDEERRQQQRFEGLRSRSVPGPTPIWTSPFHNEHLPVDGHCLRLLYRAASFAGRITPEWLLLSMSLEAGANGKALLDQHHLSPIRLYEELHPRPELDRLKVFISHRGSETDAARALFQELRRTLPGDQVSWVAGDRAGGTNLDAMIQTLIDRSTVVLALFGAEWGEVSRQRADGGERDWPVEELELARERGKMILPVLTGGCQRTPDLSQFTSAIPARFEPTNWQADLPELIASILRLEPYDPIAAPHARSEVPGRFGRPQRA